MIVPDLNLLLHAYNRDSSVHDRARTWWEGLLNGYQASRAGVGRDSGLHSHQHASPGSQASASDRHSDRFRPSVARATSGHAARTRRPPCGHPARPPRGAGNGRQPDDRLTPRGAGYRAPGRTALIGRRLHPVPRVTVEQSVGVTSRRAVSPRVARPQVRCTTPGDEPDRGHRRSARPSAVLGRTAARRVRREALHIFRQAASKERR
jgi:hypothetical protein